MLIITGTKRSGTSLWMQIAREAGFSPIGSAFPRTWRAHLEDQNPGGFYESELRRGIYHATNPHPETGRYLHPAETRTRVVKVFIPGLVKSDHAFLDRVVGSVRCWREVVASLRKMRAREAQAFHWSAAPEPPTFRPPEIEWLRETFLLVRDILTRRYPAVLIGHHTLMHDPVGAVGRVLDFVSPLLVEPADPARVARLVRADLYRNARADVGEVLFDQATAAALDGFVDAVNAGTWQDPASLSALNEAWVRAEEAGWLASKVRWDDPRIIGEGGSAPS